MESKILFTGFIKLGDKIFEGPVSTTDSVCYCWVNRSTGDDLYFYLEKYQNRWVQVEGIQEIKYPQTAIKLIGKQIEEWLLSDI